MRVLKILFLLISLAFNRAYNAQNPPKIATDFYKLLERQKTEQLFGLFDTAGVPVEYLNMLREKLKNDVTQLGKPKKLIKIIEDENSVKKQYALLMRLKENKKKIHLTLSKNGKIEHYDIKEYNESPFFQLKGYNGFSEVTNLPVTIKTTDGLKLDGNIAFGDTSKQKLPLVIFVHGSGTTDRDESIGPNKPFRDLSQGLAQQGIASIRYDKRGFDRTQLKKGMLDSIDIYIETIFDAIEATKLAKQFSFIDTTRIYIVGHSLGAMCAPKIAKLCPAVKGIVMLAGPAKNFLEVLPEQARYMALLDDTITTIEEIQLNQNKWFIERLASPEEFKKIPRIFLGGTSYRYWKSFKDFDQAGTAKTLTIPVFILNGENDFQVIMAEYELWKKELAGKQNASFKSYPKLNHLFLETVGERGLKEYDIPGHIPQFVIDDIAEFILRSR